MYINFTDSYDDVALLIIRFCYNSTWAQLSSWSLHQHRYCHPIPDTAPSHAQSGVHTSPHRRDTRKWFDDY